MSIRTYTSADFEALKVMHREQGYQWEFPKDVKALEDELFICRTVMEEPEAEGQKVRAAVLVRLLGEVYFLHMPRDGTPESRLQRFLALHDHVHYDAVDKGLDSVVCWMPPEIQRAFGGRLMAMRNWYQQEWPSFSLDLTGKRR